jgi:transcriptional regulator with XRE-family HTH domain
MSLQEEVKEYLKKYGIKKGYLATYIGIPQPYLSHWLNGRWILKESQIAKIEDFLSGAWK